MTDFLAINEYVVCVVLCQTISCEFVCVTGSSFLFMDYFLFWSQPTDGKFLVVRLLNGAVPTRHCRDVIVLAYHPLPYNLDAVLQCSGSLLRCDVFANSPLYGDGVELDFDNAQRTWYKGVLMGTCRGNPL